MSDLILKYLAYTSVVVLLLMEAKRILYKKFPQVSWNKNQRIIWKSLNSYPFLDSVSNGYRTGNFYIENDNKGVRRGYILHHKGSIIEKESVGEGPKGPVCLFVENYQQKLI